jgi:tripartite-type tricarboxylate transporter receptor subunit TctC
MLSSFRKALVFFSTLVFSGVALVAAAASEEWPSRRVTIVVPLGAGSASDLIARVVAAQLTVQTKQTFVVENRPGGGGTIGATSVARAAPDGYTILGYGALASSAALYSKLSFDPVRDIKPVIPLGRQPLVVITSPEKPYRTLQALIDYGRTHPGELNYTSAGIGSASHFGAERLLAAGKFSAQHIPFKGAAEAVGEVMAGRADFSVQLYATTLPLIRAGKLVALAVSSPERSPVLPDVATTIEAGLPPDSVYPFYSAFFVPAQTPSDVAQRLYDETARALKAADVQSKLRALGLEPMPMNMSAFRQFFQEDVEANKAIVKSANIQIE